jgi:hypothetical protein
MKMKHVYLGLCVIGTILPYFFFIQFLISNGMDIGLMISELFVNDTASFLHMDLFVSAIAALLFMVYEGRRQKMKNYWIPIASVFLVGVSLGLPLFLYLREIHLEKK